MSERETIERLALALRRVLLKVDKRSPAAVYAKKVLVEVEGEPPGLEHPWERARRLGRDLSQVLAEIRDSDEGAGMCVAVVHPAGRPYAVGFADIDSYDRGWAIARKHFQEPARAGKAG